MIARMANMLGLVAVFLLPLVMVGNGRIPLVPQPESALLLSVEHAGKSSLRCRALSLEEQAGQLAHMRETERCERGRAQARIVLWLDGREVLNVLASPLGLSGDGTISVLESLEVTPGDHHVELTLSDIGADSGSEIEEEQTYRFFERLTMAPGHRYIIAFSDAAGFKRYPLGSKP